MLNKLDYSYNYEESIIHRVNPVIKIFGLFIYVLICLLRFNYILFLANLIFVFILLLLSNIKMTKYLKIVWKLKYILVLAYVFMLYKRMELWDINVIIFNVVFFILYVSMIIYTTTKEEIGKGGSIIIDRINIIGLSTKNIGRVITNVFVYINYFIDSYNEFVIKKEIDGSVYLNKNIISRNIMFIKNIKSIHVNVKDKMKKRNETMKYRMYDKRLKWKYKYRNKLFIFDYIYVILNIVMIVFYILKVR